MRYLVVAVMLHLGSYYVCLSQPKELMIGDKVPDIHFKILRKDGKVENTSLYKIRKKLILLDFWSIHCIGCIEAFPLLDSLQDKFKNDIQIIAVNSEDLSTTLGFLKQRKWSKKPDYPMVTGDSVLCKYFPRNFVAWHIWIDSNYIVKSITSGEYANEKNFTSYLQGKLPVMRPLIYYGDYVGNKPLIAEGNGRFADRALYFSYIIPCIVGASAHNYMLPPSEESKYFRLSRNCSSIRNLYATAFSENGKYDLRAGPSIELNVKDTFAYVQPPRTTDLDDWLDQHSYDYDLYIPEARADKVYDFMKQDLNRFFNLSASMVRKKILCIVLDTLPGEDRLMSKGGPETFNFGIETDDKNYFANNMQVKIFCSILSGYLISQYHIDLPFVCRVSPEKGIDIIINKEQFDKNDLSELNRELEKYNLILTVKEEMTDVLVVSE